MATVTGRHERCPICQRGRLLVVRTYEGIDLASCEDPDCPSNVPTGPITEQIRDRAAAEVAMIRQSLRERIDRGEL